MKTYRALEAALAKGLVASSMSIERGGLGLALAKSAMAGMLGFTADLSDVPAETGRDDVMLYSESQGRVLVSVDPAKKEEFERLFAGLPLGLHRQRRRRGRHRDNRQQGKNAVVRTGRRRV